MQNFWWYVYDIKNMLRYVRTCYIYFRCYDILLQKNWMHFALISKMHIRGKQEKGGVSVVAVVQEKERDIIAVVAVQ